MEMRKICFVLMLALGGAFVLPCDQVQAGHRSIGKHQVVKKHHSRDRKIRVSRSVSLAGVTPVLAAKAREIVASCGSVIIAAVAARNIRSNHPIGRAVDLKGNPACIYAHLQGWPGGYSTDYSTARHVHISYNPGGQEWGLRFVHGSARSSVARYGRVRMSRYNMQPTFSAFARHNGHAH
jgi:hypothetical protein